MKIEKIELKHLAPYLEHNISVLDNYDSTSKLLAGLTPRGTHSVWVSTILSAHDYPREIEGIKPLLYPLSHLTKEITHNGETFKFIDKYVSYFSHDKECDEWIHYSLTDIENWEVNYKNLPVGVVDKLFECHFDVFNLIESGLAIDKSTL